MGFSCICIRNNEEPTPPSAVELSSSPNNNGSNNKKTKPVPPSPKDKRDLSDVAVLAECCKKLLTIDTIQYIFEFCDLLGEQETPSILLQKSIFTKYKSNIRRNRNSGVSNNQHHDEEIGSGVFLSSNNSIKESQYVNLLPSSRVSSPASPTSAGAHQFSPSASVFDIKNVRFEFPVFRKIWNDTVKIFIKNNDQDDEEFNPFYDTEPFHEKLCSKLIKIAFGKKHNKIISLVKHYTYSEHDRMCWKSFPVFGVHLLSFKPPSFIDISYLDDYLADLGCVNNILKHSNRLKLSLTLPVNMEHSVNSSGETILKAAREISFVEEVHSKYLIELFKDLKKINSPDWILPSLTIGMQEKFVISDEYLNQISKLPVKHLKLSLNFYHPSMPTKYLDALLGNTFITHLEIENIKLTGQLVDNIKEKINIENINVSSEGSFICLLSQGKLGCLIINGGTSYHETCTECIQKSFPSFCFNIN